jgi:DNA polymerase
VVKCRPPGNRTPEDSEMRTCGQFLEKQLQIVHPRHILCLGGTAAHYLLGTDQPMGKLRGRFFDHPATGARIMPTYHPAYLLRNEGAKRAVWEDVQRVMSEMEKPVEEAP